MIGNDYRAYVENDYNSLYHYGIKGQKKGTRRYQNPDGSLTPEGKARYAKGALATVAGAATGYAGGVALGRRIVNGRRKRTSRRASLSTRLSIYKPELGPNRKYRSAVSKAAGRIKDAARRRKIGIDKHGVFDGGSFREIKSQLPAVNRSGGGLVKSGSLRKGNQLGTYVRRGLSKKGKIGIAVAGAAALGAGGYALYKNRKKKKSAKYRR